MLVQQGVWEVALSSLGEMRGRLNGLSGLGVALEVLELLEAQEGHSEQVDVAGHCYHCHHHYLAQSLLPPVLLDP